MKKILFVFCSICIYVSLVSCTNGFNGKDDATSVILNLDTIKAGVSQSRLFDSFRFIPLENKRECLITEMDKLTDTDEGFYILDRASVPAVFLFDHDGTFKTQIGKIGHGKGEYTYIDDMTVNDRGDTIAILNGNKILFYDNHGRFLETVELDDKYGWDLIMHTSDGYLMGSYHRGYDGILALYDHKFVEKRYLGHITPDIIKGATSVRNLLQKNGKYISYFDPFASVFYVFDATTKDTLKKIMLQSSKIMTEEAVMKGDFMDESIDQLLEYLLVDDFLYCLILHQGYLEPYEIDIQRNKIRRVDSYVTYKFECEHDGYLYQAVSPYTMKSLMGKDFAEVPASLSKMRRAARALGRDFSEKDNYYIMRMTYK
ncbi:MAG: 6-bladed beta-propeller [Prevotellaceae bacterium]|nr:6-bladed beta-propeller [Prevotellaceae bacterium]